MKNLQNKKEDTVVFSQLYSKIASSLSQLGVVGNNPSSLLSIQIPGVTVETGLDPNNLSTQYYISNFLNFTLECNYVSTAKAGLVSDLYKLILDGKEMAITELTPEEKLELKNAENLLIINGEPTKTFKTYKNYALIFYCASDDLETAKATQKNGGVKIPSSVKTNYLNAFNNWESKGFKKKVENALAIIEQLQAKDRYVYWNNLNKRYLEYTKELENGSSFQFNTSIPEYKDWFKAELWTPFIFDEKDYDRQARSGGLGMKSKSCCCHPRKSKIVEHLNLQGKSVFDGVSPLPKPSIAYNERHCSTNLFASWHEKSPEAETHFKGSVEKFILSCSFKRINIIRPWLDPNVFYSRTWRWSPMSIGYGIVISTGGSVAGNDPATGVMPVLPTTALLAKDIKFTSTDSELINWLEKEFEQGKEVRFGPFRLGKGEKVFNDFIETYSIESTSAPQIFGYISTIFPESPNPDLSLKWPT